jgi:hypothetical protein
MYTYIYTERVRRSGAPPAESGAYIVQADDGRGIPRADVCVEGGRFVERLRLRMTRGPRR